MDYLLSVLFIYTCATTTFSATTLLVDISISSTVVAPNSAVQIDCSVNTTQTYTIKWFNANSNAEIFPDSSKYKLYNNGTLEINAFSKQDEGQYYCTAQNNIGSVKSLSASLQVASISTAESTLESKNFQVNQYLELPCTVPTSVPEAEVTWYKGSSIVTPDTRIGIAPNNNLVFSYCKDDDIGAWECRVKNKLFGGEQKTNGYLLNEVGPELSTSQDVEILFSPISQTGILGESLKLQCLAVGRPSPVYTWLKDNNVLEQSSHISFTQNGRILQIIDVNSEDEGLYTCQVTQTALMMVLTSEPASIVVKDPPSILSPTIEVPASPTQYASLSVSLSCSSLGSSPITWAWLRNTIIIDESDNVQIVNSVQNSVSQSHLKIQSLDPSDGGVWQCVASNNVTGSAQTTQLLTVNTTLPIIPVQPDDVLAFVGDTITLPFTCISYPFPDISWIEGNEIISLQQRHSVGGSSPFNGNLTIAPVQASDDGVYKGRCSNTDGNKITEAAVIKVIEKPVILIEPQDALVSFGSDVMVHCMIEDYSGGIIVDYSWERDFIKLPPDSEMITLYSNGSLLVKNFTVEDIGYYECAVSLEAESNSASHLEYEIGGAYLTEDPPTLPTSPINLLLGTITARNAAITWNNPLDNGGLQILGYVVELKNLGRHNCVFNGDFNTTTDATVSQLTVPVCPYSRYTVAVYAFNSLGYSNASKETEVFWALEAEPSQAPVLTSTLQGKSVGELLVRWEHPPCETRNGRITSYIIKLTSTVQSLFTTTDNSTSFVIRQLRALEDYSVQVSAATEAGSGPFSTPLLATTTLASVPNIPRNLNATVVNSTMVHISWDSPKPQINEPLNDQTIVTQYIVQYNSMEVAVMETSYTTLDLQTGSSVVFSVSGVNSFGRGNSSRLEVSLPTEPPMITDPPTTPVINETNESIAFYQEVWFPVFAGGIAGGTLLAVVVICAFICIISYCCRKNNKHNRSFSSEYTTSGSVHSFTYPNRKSTVLDKIMQVEMMESQTPDGIDGGAPVRSSRTEASNDSGNGQDSGSVCTMTTSQSSGTLRSKYQYRSPMEQEQYQQLSDFRSMNRSTRQKGKDKGSSRSKKLENVSLKSFPNPTLQNTRSLHITRELSPTDTVSSFEYQSRSQMIPQQRTKRLPSYTTDGYDTSSEDDSVFHSVHTHHNPRATVARNNSFKVTYDSKNVPNLALMTALPLSVDPPFMPYAIPTTPTAIDSPSLPPVSNKPLNRVPRSRTSNTKKQFHGSCIEEKATFV